MQFESLKLRGIGPFKSEQQIDLPADGAIIAISGENGAGKSMLLGALPGALYRELPRRRHFESLASVAVSRDAFVEVVVKNGARYTVRQTIDNVSGKGETLILNAQGETVLDSAKVSDGDRWIRDHFPSSEVLYSGPFAPQGKQTSFLDMKESERKALLLELLDLQRYERMSSAAVTHAGEARAKLAVLRGRLSALPEVDLDALLCVALAAKGNVDTALGAVDLARRSLERARAAAGDANRLRDLAEQRAAAEGRLAQAVGQVADIETRIANNRGLLDRAEEIRSAQTRAEELEGELAALEQQAQKLAETVRVAESAREAIAREHAYLTSELVTADRRMAAATLRLRDKAAVQDAVRLIEENESTFIPDIERKLAEANDAVEAEQHVLLLGKDERITGLRSGLRTIADVEEVDWAPVNAWARNTLANDDGREAEAARAPEALKKAKDEVAACRNALKIRRDMLVGLRATAARAGDMEAAERDLADASASAAIITEKVEVVRARLAIASETSPAQRESDGLRARLTVLKAEWTALREVVALVAKLDAATVRMEELGRTLAQQQEAKAAAERELAALPVVTVQAVDVGEHERALAAHERIEREAREAFTRATDAAAAGEASLTARKLVAADITVAETTLADWTRIGQDLGRDGLQAFEIDAALPALNAMSNHLLHSCLGTRWTVEIQTDRLSADGKKQIEGLPVRVLDTQEGREADADTYSGGEFVLINEACSLALTMLACQRAGIERPTIVRDETGAALSTERARQYVSMLRLAAKQLDAANVLLVSHSDDVRDLCDRQVRIADGRIC